jgi:hypothetical protein
MRPAGSEGDAGRDREPGKPASEPAWLPCLLLLLPS